MTFPKDRDGFSNRGDKDARALTGLDVPFLTRRRLPGVLQPGTIARKRGDFLEVRLIEQPVAPILGAPFLWSILFRLTPGASSELRYRRYGWGARATADSVEQLRNPSYVPLGREWYAGGGYVLQHAARSQDADALEQWPTWLSLIAIGDTTGVEVLSKSAENKAGRNVSFHDVAQLLPTDARFWIDAVDNGRPHAFVTGWDAAAKGYGFGYVGRTVSASIAIVGPLTAQRDGINASVDDQYAMAAWWGDTALRSLQRVDLVGDTFRCAPTFVLHSVRPGRAMALVTRYRSLARNPNPESEQVYASGHDLGMLRTDDHGRSWTMEEVPEIKALLLRNSIGDIVYEGLGATGRTIPGLGFVVMAPLDNAGRIGAIVRISRAPGQNIGIGTPPDWPGPADRWTSQHYQTWNTRNAFLVSDVDGRNWVRKAWPLDSVPANIDGLFYDNAAYPLGTWVPFLSVAQVHNPVHSAGAGSFFVARFEVQHANNQDNRSDQPHRARMVFTLDAGDTWQESPLLPDALAKDNVRRAIWPIVAKPFKSPEAPGEIYLVAPAAGSPARVRIFRTDATFASFTSVYDQAVENLYLSGQGQSDLNALFIGDASGDYPPRLRPGFPEFDKP